MAEPLADRFLISTHHACELHNPGAGHPERSARIPAVLQGVEMVGAADRVRLIEAPLAPDHPIAQVHDTDGLARVDTLSAAGGGMIDADTFVSSESAEAARRAAGAGLDLIDRLDRGEATIGWSVVRPPGHHATERQQMGFCLVNNIAVAARVLADRGERVAIVDVDAHHGNGTQDIFYSDPRVLFVSLHQYPAYPNTGGPTEIGHGDASYTTLNVPLPPGATGDVYRAAFDRVIGPRIEAFNPTWLLVSLGFDAHRHDPLTDLGLTSGDYGDIASAVLGWWPHIPRLMFLEGGYDLDALVRSSAAVVGVVLGVDGPVQPETVTSGGPGMTMVDRMTQLFSGNY